MTERRPMCWLIVVLALATTSSGCLSPSSPPSTSTPTPTPDGQDPPRMAAGFTLQDCFMPAVLVPVATAFDEGSMPVGFTLVSDNPATNTVAYRGLTCARTDGRDVRASLLDSAARVVPPPEFTDPTITDYEMSDGGYVQGDLLAPLVSWGNNTPLLFIEAAITSTQTPLAGAATGSVESKTNNLTVTMDWTAAGPAKESGRTYRLFLADSLHNPWRLVGAIDITVSDSDVLTTGTGDFRFTSGLGVGGLPATGATLHSGFTVQMRPAPAVRPSA